MKEKKMNLLKPYENALLFSRFFSENSRGRRQTLAETDEDSCYFGAFDPFFIDKEKLRMSPALARLNHVTQVFTNRREHPSVRNRFMHTTEVCSIAVSIAKILGLNVHLTEAIALGHDIGHSFYGHLGESLISEYSGRKFRHEVMSVVVAQKIERAGRGLNLSWETLEGIKYHSRADRDLQLGSEQPLEYGVVVYADKLACIFSDLEDALCLGHFKSSDLPSEFFQLGANQKERVFNCVLNLIRESAELQKISFEQSEVAQQFESLRQWNYKNFYYLIDQAPWRASIVKSFKEAYPILVDLFGQLEIDIFLALALMTDRDLYKLVKLVNANHKDLSALFKPGIFKNFSFFQVLFALPEGEKISIFNADLDASKFKKYDYLAEW